MSTHHQSLFLKLLAFMAATFPFIASGAGPEYTFVNTGSPGGPTYEWIDISSTGATVVVFGDNTASTSPAPAGINSPVTLGNPFTFYGTRYTSLVPCVNGYISVSASEIGADSTNDCPFPATPNAGPDAPRLLVLHDDHELFNASSQIRYQYFEESPHPHRSCGVSVFSWIDLKRVVDSSASPVNFFSIQALLFDNGDIIYQYNQAPGNFFDSSATVGVYQGGGAGIASHCNSASSIPNGHAILFEPPRITVTTDVDELTTPASNGSGISLREAIRDAGQGFKIDFSNSIPTPALKLALGSLSISDKNLTIDATAYTGNSQPITIIGDGAIPSLLVNPTSTTSTRSVFLEGLHFTSSGGSKGAVVLSHDILTISCCEFFENSTRAVLAEEDTYLVVCDSKFLNNTLPSLNLSGGAIQVEDKSFLSIARSIFARNRAPLGDGGAIHMDNSLSSSTTFATLNIDDCLFYKNVATSGGAVWARGQINGPPQMNITINNSAFCMHSTPGKGAGLFVGSAITDITNSTFSNNTSATDGGAIFADGNNINQSLTLAFCTIYENNAGRQGPGIFSNVDVTVNHTITAKNLLRNGTQNNYTFNATIGSNGATADYNLSDLNESFLSGTNDLTSTDPLLSPLGPYGGIGFSHMPLVGSPVIEAGGSGGTSPPSTDQRGFSRFGNGDNISVAFADIGAVEAGAFTTVTAATTANFLAALGSAPAGGRVLFDSSLSGATITLNDSPYADGHFTFGDITLFIDASDLASNVILDAPNIVLNDWEFVSVKSPTNPKEYHGLGIHSIDFTDAPGLLSLGGGVIVEPGGRLGLIDCNFSNCASVGGGGAIANQGTLFTTDCQFVSCSAISSSGASAPGGALHNTGESFINTCQFLENSTTRWGGAIYDKGFLCIIDSYFNENSASQNGGAIFTEGPDPDSYLGCTFSNNTSGGRTGGTQFGGGGVIDTADTTCTNCTWSSNTAVTGGGGVTANTDGTVEIFRSTIYGNNSTNGGGGVHLIDTLCQFRNTILAKNANDSGPSNLFADAQSTSDSLGWNIESGEDADFTENTKNDQQNTDPLLSPLAWHGGPTPTHHPLAHSPAIENGQVLPASESTPDERWLPLFDQRGYNRLADGDASGGIAGVALDVGAVEASFPTIVTTSSDTASPGSLRHALVNADHGDRITFNPSLSGNTIDMRTAAGGQGNNIVVNKDLIVDAAALPDGITLRAPSSGRILDLQTNRDTAIYAVSFQLGNGGFRGGAIRNTGDLAIAWSCFDRNRAADDGGAIHSQGPSLLLENVTFSENDAEDRGGAIHADNGCEVTMRHCTVYQNESDNGGAGIHLNNAFLSQFASVIAFNNREGGSPLANVIAVNGGSFESLGYLLTDNPSIPSPHVTDIVNSNANLDTLQDSGGYACVRPPLTGSLIVNNGPTPLFGIPCSDSRGLKRVFASRMDIGAFELGPYGVDSDNDGMDDNWERFYGLDPNSNDADGNLDGDDDTNIVEYGTQSNPAKPNPGLGSLTFEILTLMGPARQANISWPVNPGVTYYLYRSVDLENWTLVTSSLALPSDSLFTVPVIGNLLLDDRLSFFTVTTSPISP
ncbi:MAG: choice-of-anchor Q domain-containing protein [Verrucomicrobiota bacterium]